MTLQNLNPNKIQFQQIKQHHHDCKPKPNPTVSCRPQTLLKKKKLNDELIKHKKTEVATCLFSSLVVFVDLGFVPAREKEPTVTGSEMAEGRQTN